MYEVEFNKFSQKEYDKLDGSQKAFINKGIKPIREIGMTAGSELSGELKGCRKLKFKNAGLRIIFNQYNQKIEVIEIVALGKRSDKEVYKMLSNA